jgi:hypothetical protein
MACSLILPEFKHLIDCPPEPLKVKVDKFSGVVSEIRLECNALYFKIGVMPLSICNFKDIPDWFVNGATVEVDIENSVIEKATC